MTNLFTFMNDSRRNDSRAVFIWMNIDGIKSKKCREFEKNLFRPILFFAWSKSNSFVFARGRLRKRVLSVHDIKGLLKNIFNITDISEISVKRLDAIKKKK